MSSSESAPSLVLPMRGGAPPPLTWRSWPLVEPTLAGVCGVVLLVSAVIVAIVQTTGRWDWAVLVCGAMAVSAWRLFVPVVFEVSAMGVTQQIFGRDRRLPWQTIRRARFGVRGLRVFSARNSWGDATTYIPFGSHRSELEALLDYYLPPRIIERD